MIVKNFNYRTNEMLLQSQFKTEGKYSIYKILKFDFKNEGLEYIIEGQRLREITTKVKVWDRTI